MDLTKEAGIVIQVLRMDTLSKLTFSDSTKFDSIIKDVFKNVKLELIQNDLMIKSVEKSFEELGLIKNERQVSITNFMVLIIVNWSPDLSNREKNNGQKYNDLHGLRNSG